MNIPLFKKGLPYAPNKNQLPTGEYLIVSKSLGKCLDSNTYVPKQYHKDYLRCFLADISFAASQKWVVVNTNDTTDNGEHIYLIFACNNMSLDGCDDSSVPQYDKTSPSPFLSAHQLDTLTQQWLLVQPSPDMLDNVFYMFCRATNRLVDANVDRAKHIDTKNMSPYMGGYGYVQHVPQANKCWQFVPWPAQFLDPVIPSGKFMIRNVASGHYICLSSNGTLEMKLPDFAGAADTVWLFSYVRSPNEYSIQICDKVFLEMEQSEHLSVPKGGSSSSDRVLKPCLSRTSRNNSLKDLYRWKILTTHSKDSSLFIVNVETSLYLDGSAQLVDIKLGEVFPPFLDTFEATHSASKMWQMIPVENTVQSPTEEWTIIDDEPK